MMKKFLLGIVISGCLAGLGYFQSHYSTNQFAEHDIIASSIHFDHLL